MEIVIALLAMVALSVWAGLGLLEKLLRKKDTLKVQPFTILELGLSEEQMLRLCALARAQGVEQRTLYKRALLAYLAHHADGGKR